MWPKHEGRELGAARARRYCELWVGYDNHPARKERTVVRSLRRGAFAAAALFASFAGFIDGFGFVYLGGYFVSFMSGNSTRVGVDLVTGDFGAAGLAFLLIASFVGGVMVGTLIARPSWISVFLIAALVFAAVAAYAELTAAVGVLLAASMGAKNTVFASDGATSFGVTYMTGALVKFGQGLITAIHTPDRFAWARPITMWAAIAIGAALGAASIVTLGISGLWIVIAAHLLFLLLPVTRAWLQPAPAAPRV